MMTPSGLQGAIFRKILLGKQEGSSVRVFRIYLLTGLLVMAFAGSGNTAWALQPGDPARGKEVYNQYCYKCHGMNGDGKGEVGGVAFPPPSNFRDPALWKGKPDSFFIDVITNGYNYGKMPPWWDVISKQDIQDVFAYIKTFRPK